MTADTKSQKRKAAQSSAPPTKKIKKSSSTSAKKSTKAPTDKTSSAALPLDSLSSEPAALHPPRRSGRKHATDFFTEDNPAEPEAPKAKKLRKSTKPSEVVSAVSVTEEVLQDPQKALPRGNKPSEIIKTKTSKKAKSNGVSIIDTAVIQTEPEQEDLGNSSANDDADQTAALLKGFESSDEDDGSGDEGFEKGRPVPALPQDKKLQRKLKGVSTGSTQEPGAVYVGRIPHGFYEHQMRQYFSQFGEISRLRLSRNPKTGASKHYAFIEFTSSEVAQIVADTMNNYLMFGHILKCQVVPQSQLHPELWKGANRRFKKVPWSRIEGRKLAMAKPREIWERKVGLEREKREKLSAKMKEIGYDFEAPSLKGIEDMPIREETKLIEAGPDDDADGATKESTAIIQTEITADGTIEETTTTVEREEPNTVVVREEVSVAKPKKGNDGKKKKKEKKSKKAG
ncbi:MAG: hypothetical protein M1837_000448 [Sclerophora amabilis]|nr:MAG: hypothetical protein M1837_000448 [Sclerophora amabilis]